MKGTSGKHGPFTHGGVFSALGHRGYLIFWTGAFISNTGTWIQTTALLWYVKTFTDSNGWVGAVNMSNYLPVLLLALFAGYAADRFDRKKLIIATFAVMLVSTLVLAISKSLGANSLPVIMVTTFITGAASLALAVGGGACVALAVLLFALPGLLRGADSRLGEDALAAA